MGLFVKVVTTQELEALEAGKLVEAAGQRIAIFNLGGKYWAIEDTCPHRGGPLSEGMLYPMLANASTWALNAMPTAPLA
jgi:nitrite reductase/ring-hydroxylating ferredoxin subunit